MSGYQLGIGMSARSHLGYTVYRNHEQLPIYLERVEQGQSPVEQVFRLAEDDRMTQFVARTLGDGKPLVRAHYERIFGRPVDEDFGEVLARLRSGAPPRGRRLHPRAERARAARLRPRDARLLSRGGPGSGWRRRERASFVRISPAAGAA